MGDRADLETLLADARQKNDAHMAESRQTEALVSILDQLDELRSRRPALERVAGKAGGPLTLVSQRRRERVEAAEQELLLLDMKISSLEVEQSMREQRRARLAEAASGADLARARVGAEIKRLTSRLASDDPARHRLAALDVRREQAVRERNLAIDLASSAGLGLEVVTSIDNEENILSELFLSIFLKDHLERVWVAGRDLAQEPLLSDLRALATENRGDSLALWVAWVAQVLKRALDFGVGVRSAVEDELASIDAERIRLLS